MQSSAQVIHPEVLLSDAFNHQAFIYTQFGGIDDEKVFVEVPTKGPGGVVYRILGYGRTREAALRNAVLNEGLLPS